MKPISRSHENGTECDDAVSREQVLKLFSTHDGKYLYEAIQMLPSVTLKPDHSGDTTEMVEYDDCISRQAVADVAYEVGNLFDGEDDTRTPYGAAFDIQMAVDKLPSVTPKPEPCDDAVSRKAVYEAMIEKGQHSRRYRLGETWELNGTEIRETLDTVPSVTPKRKTGKWIEFDSDEDKYDVIKCSECGHIFTVDSYHWTDIGFVKDDFKFCPNCGSKNGDVRNE